MKKRIFLVFALLLFSVFAFGFASAANLIVFNNSNPSQNPYFVVNGTTGNVGIGTGTPTAPLYILPVTAGNSSILLSTNSATDGTRASLDFHLSSNQANNLGARVGAIRVGANAASDLFFSTTDIAGSYTERMRITTNGTVGINTTNPRQTFEVVGIGNFSGTVYIGGRNDLNLNLTYLWGQNTSLWNTALNKYNVTYHNFWASNTTIWNAINAGVSTYNSSYVPYTGATGAVNLGSNGVTAGSFTTGDWALTSNAWPGTGGFTYSGSNNTVTFGISSGGGKASLQLDGQLYVKEDSAVYSDYIYDDDGGILRLQSDGGTSYFGGSIGIGTASPSRTLDVRGEGNFSGTILLNNTNNIVTNLTTIVNNAQANATSLVTAVSNLQANSTSLLYLYGQNTSLWNEAKNKYNASYLSTYNSSYVPYTGATGNLIMGSYNITIGAGRTSPKATLDINGSLSAVSHVSHLGSGSYAIGNNSFILGAVRLSGNLTSIGYGSLVTGYSTGGGILLASGDGSLSRGYTDTGILSASGRGSIVQGYSNGGNISATADGSFAGGMVPSGGNISASGGGSISFGHSNGGNISTTGQGSFATGSAEFGTHIFASAQGSLARGTAYSANIIAEGIGSTAQGYSQSYSIVSRGEGSFASGRSYMANITAEGIGSTALGYAANGDVISSGDGSFTWGDAVYNYGDNSFVLGAYLENTKNNAFVVGFDTSTFPGTPIIFANATQVGIGTGTPTKTLDVRGDGNFSGTVYIGGRNDLNLNLTYLWAQNASLWTEAWKSYNVTYNDFWRSNSTIWTAINAGTSTYNASYVPYTGATSNLIMGLYNITIGAGRTSPKATLDINGSLAAIYQSGTGVYNVRYSSQALGSVYSTGNLSSIGDGSIAQGYVQLGNLTSSSTGSFSQGHVMSGSLVSSGLGSFSQGYINSGYRITASGAGSFAQGASQAGGSTLISSGTGSFAQGNPVGGSIISLNAGSFAQGAVQTSGNLSSSGEGSFAQGYASFGNMTSSGYGSVARGYVSMGNIISSGIGSVAGGAANAGGNITSSSWGSFAGGAALGGGITASGTGSFVWGNASSSSGNYGIVFGTGINNAWNNSFSVGFGASSVTPTLFVNGSGVGIGRINPNSTLDVNGSFAAIMYFAATGGRHSINSYSQAIGTIAAVGNITSSGLGSMAMGYTHNSNIISTQQGSLARGSALAGGVILSTSRGSLAQGHAASLGNISASMYGSIASGYADGGNITAAGTNGFGSIAHGYVVSTGEILALNGGAMAYGIAAGGKIVSSGPSSFAQGYVAGGNMTSSGISSIAQGYANYGNISSTGSGSFAGGAAIYGNIYSSGTGSFVWGNASSSSGNYGIVFGTGINNAYNNSFSVGFGNIGSTPSLFVNGSAVGIGTTKPTVKLHVNGSDGIIANFTAPTNPQIYLTGSSVIGLLTASDSSGVYVGTSSNHALNLYANGATRAYINTNGNFGIGTTNPSNARLVVNGTANSNSVFFLGSLTTGQSYGLHIAAGSNATDYALRVTNVSESSDYFMIRGNGNVGIATTTPQAKLHVQGDVILNASAVGGNVIIQL